MPAAGDRRPAGETTRRTSVAGDQSTLRSRLTGHLVCLLRISWGNAKAMTEHGSCHRRRRNRITAHRQGRSRKQDQRQKWPRAKSRYRATGVPLPANCVECHARVVDARGVHFGCPCRVPFVETQRANEQPVGRPPEPLNSAVCAGNGVALRCVAVRLDQVHHHLLGLADDRRRVDELSEVGYRFVPRRS